MRDIIRKFLFVGLILPLLSGYLGAGCLLPGVDRDASVKKALEVTSAVGIITTYQSIYRFIPQGSGVLISDDLVLTAAHVASDLPSSIREGTATVILRDKDGNEDHAQVESVYIHPHYGDAHYVDDIALLRLSSPVDIDRYVPAVLCRDLRAYSEGQRSYKVAYGSCPLEVGGVEALTAFLKNIWDPLGANQKLYYENECSGYDYRGMVSSLYQPNLENPLGCRKYDGDKPLLEFQGVTTPGDSGGPEFNDRNELIGLIVRGTSASRKIFASFSDSRLKSLLPEECPDYIECDDADVVDMLIKLIRTHDYVAFEDFSLPIAPYLDWIDTFLGKAESFKVEASADIL